MASMRLMASMPRTTMRAWKPRNPAKASAWANVMPRGEGADRAWPRAVAAEAAGPATDARPTVPRALDSALPRRAAVDASISTTHSAPTHVWMPNHPQATSERNTGAGEGQGVTLILDDYKSTAPLAQ